MSHLDQKINVDYYKILGIKNNASIQEVCSRYHPYHLVIEILLYHIIQLYNTKILTEPINDSQKSQKLLMSCMIVILMLFS